ncbi:MAG: XRE family transcriptional regulator [Candidatus Nealsonbacteria bacterium]|nr:MAG: XRE family transcriptional regulator [Candidatus Nealsonbacteria bacterium]
MLAKKIRDLRIKKGLSQEKLARLADVSYNTVVKIESGESKNPTFQTMAGIAKALGVVLDTLAENKSAVPNRQKNIDNRK